MNDLQIRRRISTSLFNKFSNYSAIYLIVATVSLTVLLTACDSTDSEPLTGNVVGFVQPIDQWGREIEDKKGINVQLSGASVADITDGSGHYKLTGVEPGIYTLTFSKEGFGTMKLPFYQFTGNGEDFVLSGREMLLGKIPDYTITLDSIYVDNGFGNKVITAAGSIQADPPEDGKITIITYVGKGAEISPKDFSTYLGIGVTTIFIGPFNPNPVSFGSNFNLFAYTPGETLYFRSYPIADALLFYIDPSGKTYERIYCCLGEATQTKEFAVPDYNANMSFETAKNSFPVTVNRKGRVKTKFFRIPENTTSSDIAKLREKIASFISK